MPNVESYIRLTHSLTKLLGLYDLTATEILVAQSICVYAGQKGQAWASQAAIADSTNRTTRQVRRAIKSLIQKGLIATLPSDSRFRIYVLTGDLAKCLVSDRSNKKKRNES